MPVAEEISAFKSPTRVQLQNYEAKEQVSHPSASQYRPSFDQVLRREAQSTAPFFNPVRSDSQTLL